MKCFYHSADLDGHCSGAIVKYFHPECELFPINYGQEFQWNDIVAGERVFMVDFALQPFAGMLRLSQLADLVWIDHHKTAIEEAQKTEWPLGGIRRDGLGACALAWEYCTHKKAQTPYAIRLLAEYDVWNHQNPMTLPFQYGMRLKETRPDKAMPLWTDLFEGGADACETIATAGSTVLEYERQTNAKFCRSYAFDTTFVGYKAICVNKGFTSSKVFDSVWDPEKYDIMITFCRLPLPKGQWTVSLYSDKHAVDCGAIAKVFGGGGHKGAAGFQCENLPFIV